MGNIRRGRKATKQIEPTEEQQQIISSEVGKQDLMVLNAYAGTGKTTTLELYARAWSAKRFLYLCFNSDAAQGAKKRFPKNTECRTTHSLAFQQRGFVYQRLSKLGQPRPLDLMRRLHLDAPYLAVFVLETLQSYLYSTDAEIHSGHLPQYNFPPQVESLVLESTLKLWELMKSEEDNMPMSHDGYLKLWALDRPDLTGYDVILLDEAQDTNPVVLQVLLEQHLHARAGLIFVGDIHQSIYGWRKAVNAMQIALTNASFRLSLKECFRFGPAIALNASRVLNQWKHDPVCLNGHGPNANLMPSTVIIGRTNAAVLGRAIPAALKGQKLHFSATNPHTNWDPYEPYNLQLALDVYSLWCGKAEDIKTPYMRGFSSFEEVVEHVAGDPHGRGIDHELKKQVELVNTYGDELPPAIQRLREQAGSPEEADVSFSTAHRSKGGEWREVEMLDDFEDLTKIPEAQLKQLLPNPGFQEGINLLYVTMTRASHAIQYPEWMSNWLQGEPHGS
jgi:hypothetical protein